MNVAIITGGSRGLGKNAALACADKEIDAIITYKSSKAEAEAVVAEIRKKGRKAAALQLDVTDTGSFEAFGTSVRSTLEKEFGVAMFDSLVNNAGIGINAPIMSTTEKQFDELVDIHLKAPYFLTQTLMPLMNDGGRIVNLSSGLARFSLPGFAAYGAMKGGLDVLTRYMAREFGERKITAIAVAPGAIETDFGGGFVRDNKEANEWIASLTALGRVGLPDDIGGAIAALLTEDFRWLNGQRVELSGGIFL